MTDHTGPILQAKKDEIEEQMRVLEKPPPEQETIGFGKRIGEGTSMAVDRLSQVGVHDGLRSILVDVDRGLAKIDEGTHGICDACGQPIGDERLEALPWAVLCVKDAGRR